MNTLARVQRGSRFANRPSWTQQVRDLSGQSLEHIRGLPTRAVAMLRRVTKRRRPPLRMLEGAAATHVAALDASWAAAEESQGAAAWGVAARTHAASGRYREASEAAQNALALHPVDFRTWKLLAVCYEQMGQVENACAAWARHDELVGPERDWPQELRMAHAGVRERPGSREAWATVAQVFSRTGRDAEAIALARAALARDPSLHAAIRPLSNYVINRTPHDTWDLLGDMLAADPSNVHYRHLRGLAGSKAGKGEEAIELLRETAQLRRTDRTYWYALGRALERNGAAGHEAEAADAYRRALALNSSYAKAQTRLHALQFARSQGEDRGISSKGAVQRPLTMDAQGSR